MGKAGSGADAADATEGLRSVACGADHLQGKRLDAPVLCLATADCKQHGR